MLAKFDLTGMRFGRLLVTGYAGSMKGRGRLWGCVCDCGTTKTISYTRLKGGTRSCGCLHREIVSQANSTHRDTTGGKRTPEYRIWGAMISRCYTPTDTTYQYYGACGITVCERWRKSFAAFLEDMGRRPTPKHQIDRINNLRGYSPGNCRWATRSQQMRNTRRTKFYTCNGRTMLLIEWAEELGIPIQTLRTRLRDGWSVEDTLSKPNDCQNRYITHAGKTLTLAQWARKLKITPAGLHRRLKRLPSEQALNYTQD